jgi:hypothetical protein
MKKDSVEILTSLFGRVMSSRILELHFVCLWAELAWGTCDQAPGQPLQRISDVSKMVYPSAKLIMVLG